MLTVFRLKTLMGSEQTIKFDNGIVLQKSNDYDEVLVMKVKGLDVQWVDTFTNLPERGKALVVKMLRARKVMLSFDTEFNIVTTGTVIEKPNKKEK